MKDKLLRALRWLWVAPFAGLGWLWGVCVKAVHLARAGLQTGYEEGREL